MTSKTKPTDPYAKAGVNIEKGNELVDSIKASVNATHDRRVLGGIGGFAGLFQLGSKYKNPVLVGCTDGVGTKVALSQAHDKTHLTGQDLVAMCVNDMVTCGAEPLFFLDYFAASKLEPKSTAKIVKGIANACKKSNCALLGGETAEMPGHYAKNNFDLAGFSVGVVEKADLIDGKGIKPGHILLGVESSGPHSNGYSLIRSILKKHKAPNAIMQTLLKPTHLYPAPVLELIKKTNVKGMAHITGGGLTENIPRVIPNEFKAVISKNSWKIPKLFNWIKSEAHLDDNELFKTFNCGIGMAIIVKKESKDRVMVSLRNSKENAFEIGKITKKVVDEPQIQII